jgi:hypothetical protein
MIIKILPEKIRDLEKIKIKVKMKVKMKMKMKMKNLKILVHLY